MEIKVITTTASDLKSKIFKAVKDEKLETWIITSGKAATEYLTPKATQYNDLVYLKFTIDDATKNLVIVPKSWNNREQATEPQKAIVLGMITASLLTHFRTEFTKLETT